MTKQTLTTSLLAIATLVLSMNAYADGGAKFAACVEQNGGSLPALTAEQQTAKKSCWKNNINDKDSAKQCIEALNLPKPDGKTQDAINICKANSKTPSNG